MKRRPRHLQIYLQKSRTARNLNRRKLSAIRAALQQLRTEGKKPKLRRRKSISGREVIECASPISLTTPARYEHLLELVRTIRRLVLDRNKKIALDLRACPDISAAAALKLHAEINVLDGLQPSLAPTVTVLLPKGKRPRAFLSRVQFGRGADDAVSTGIPGVLPLQSHTKGATALPELLVDMNKSLYNGQAVTSGDAWKEMSTALSEAMLNVNHHAYTVELPGSTQRVVWPERQTFVTALGKRWWVLGETHGRQMFLAIYDKGVGIPKALQSKELRLKRLLDRFAVMAAKRYSGGADSGLIKAAMALGRSGTKRAGRGYGLSEILKFVQENPSGVLTIYSNKGVYQYSKDSGEELLFEHTSSIHGTLIQWNSSLPDSVNIVS